MTDVTGNAAPRRRASVLLSAFALLLALLALALIAWIGWQQRQVRTDGAAQLQQVQTRVVAADREASSTASRQQAVEQRLDAMESDRHAERDAAQGLDQRMRNLEAALGALSDQQLHGHDMLLLDDAEFLLVTEQQRFELLHDAQGALRACKLAEGALAHVQNPAFAPARESTSNECVALAQAVPSDQREALATLSSVRQQVPVLQPVESRSATTALRPLSAWSKLWHAFGSVLRIQHDDDAQLPVADAGLSRELLQLDLAQAQAALLAGDWQAYRTALASAASFLDKRFDKNQSSVQMASAALAKLASQPAPAAFEAGHALAVLRGLRASQGLLAMPAPAATTGIQQNP